jgi:hypothetical protein
MKDKILKEALLCIQNALIDEITPCLCAVSINLNEQKSLFTINYFYYENPPASFFDDLSCITTEATACLGFYANETFTQMTPSTPILSNNIFVYLEKEITSKLPPILDLTYEEFAEWSVLLAFQRTLLGVITKELEAVIVNIDTKKNSIHVQFYHNKQVPTKIKLLWKNTIDNTYNSLEKFHPNLTNEIILSKTPVNLEPQENYVFKRKKGPEIEEE